MGQYFFTSSEHFIGVCRKVLKLTYTDKNGLLNKRPRDIKSCKNFCLETLVCCPDGLVDSTGRRGSSAGRLPLVREEAVGTGDRQPPWREPWWWLLLLEGWSWWSWLLWLPQTGCNGLGTWNGRQTTAAMKHHVGDYQGCPLWWSRFFQTGWEWLSFHWT